MKIYNIRHIKLSEIVMKLQMSCQHVRMTVLNNIISRHYVQLLPGHRNKIFHNMFQYWNMATNGFLFCYTSVSLLPVNISSRVLCFADEFFFLPVMISRTLCFADDFFPVNISRKKICP